MEISDLNTGMSLQLMLTLSLLDGLEYYHILWMSLLFSLVESQSSNKNLIFMRIWKFLYCKHDGEIMSSHALASFQGIT